MATNTFGERCEMHLESVVIFITLASENYFFYGVDIMVNESNILDCIKVMQDTRLYINELENKVSDLENNQTLKSLLSYIQFYIYHFHVLLFHYLLMC